MKGLKNCKMQIANWRFAMINLQFAIYILQSLE
jgi:hypothetical protein